MNEKPKLGQDGRVTPVQLRQWASINDLTEEQWERVKKFAQFLILQGAYDGCPFKCTIAAFASALLVGDVEVAEPL